MLKLSIYTDVDIEIIRKNYILPYFLNYSSKMVVTITAFCFCYKIYSFIQKNVI